MMNSSSDAAGTDLAKLPETTPEERAVLSAHIARRKQKRPSPRVKLVEKAGSSEEGRIIRRSGSFQPAERTRYYLAARPRCRAQRNTLGHSGGRRGWGVPEKPRDNPMHRLQDWRLTR
jgi:hypothetical protein